MICRCVQDCSLECSGEGHTDEQKYLCDACWTDWMLGGPCGLPQKPSVFEPIEPAVPLTDEQKDRAIENAVSEAIG